MVDFSREEIRDMVLRSKDGQSLECIAHDYKTTRERVRISIKKYLEEYNPMRGEMERFIRSWDRHKAKLPEEYVWDVNSVVRTIEKLINEMDDKVLGKEV